MKILFVAIDISSRHGGIQRFNQRVLRCLDAFAADGHETRAVSVRDDDQTVGSVHIKGSRGSKTTALTTAMSAALTWQPDVILLGHVLLTPLATAARVLAPKAKSLLFVHGYEVWDDPDLLTQPKWLKYVTKMGVHRVVSVSNHTANRMRTAFGMPNTPIDLLPNALDLDDTPAQSAQPAAPAAWQTRNDLLDARQILTVSRLDEWGKGVDWVIRSLPYVIERIGPVKYVVAGDGKLFRDHIRVAEEFEVVDHVTFAGRVSDEELERLYRTSSVFALPSTKEGFGIVYLEAWKHGLPVIAGNRDAGAEVVDDNVNGRVVDPTDARAIADALVELLTDPEKSRQFGLAGNEKLRNEYGHDRFEARLRNILMNVARDRTPEPTSADEMVSTSPSQAQG